MGPPGRPSCLPPRVPTFQPHLPNTHKPTIELSFPSGPCDSLDLARTDSKILGGQRASHTFPAHCPPSCLTYCMCVTGALRRRRQGWAPSWSCTSLACLISRPGNHHCNPPLSSQGPHSTIPPLSPGQQQGTCLGGGAPEEVDTWSPPTSRQLPAFTGRPGGFPRDWTPPGREAAPLCPSCAGRRWGLLCHGPQCPRSAFPVCRGPGGHDS